MAPIKAKFHSFCGKFSLSILLVAFLIAALPADKIRAVEVESERFEKDLENALESEDTVLMQELFEKRLKKQNKGLPQAYLALASEKYANPGVIMAARAADEVFESQTAFDLMLMLLASESPNLSKTLSPESLAYATQAVIDAAKEHGEEKLSKEEIKELKAELALNKLDYLILALYYQPSEAVRKALTYELADGPDELIALMREKAFNYGLTQSKFGTIDDIYKAETVLPDLLKLFVLLEKAAAAAEVELPFFGEANYINNEGKIKKMPNAFPVKGLSPVAMPETGRFFIGENEAVFLGRFSNDCDYWLAVMNTAGAADPNAGDIETASPDNASTPDNAASSDNASSSDEGGRNNSDEIQSSRAESLKNTGKSGDSDENAGNRDKDLKENDYAKRLLEFRDEVFNFSDSLADFYTASKIAVKDEVYPAKIVGPKGQNEFLPVFLSTDEYLHPEGDYFLSCISEFNQDPGTFEYLKPGEPAGKVMFLLKDGSSISVEAGPDKATAGQGFYQQRLVPEMRRNPSLMQALFFSLICLCLILLKDAIKDLLKCFKIFKRKGAK